MFGPALICYNVNTARLLLRTRDHHMADRDTDPRPKNGKEHDEKVRDLPAHKDIKGGKAKDKQSDAPRTGEIDFMKYLD